MIRKLAFALSLLGAVSTGFVHALGLGEAEIKSSLNQPLRAEIELVNVKDLGVEEILPGLATREEFLKASIDRVYFLSDIRFKVEENASGDMVVVLTTNKPVREPFLNFLVEVIWPSGRLLREYALLIDPPVFTEQKSQPVQSPVVEDAPSASTQSVSGDVVAMPSRQPAKQASRVEVGGSYGPTDANDTLWDIALQARPNRSVSPQQVMLAIQDLNPGAFIDGNINKMKAGQVLRLPTMDQIKQRSTYDAINEVIAQNEALRPAKQKAVVSASKVKVPQQAGSGASASSDELKLVVGDKASSPIDSANSGDSETGGKSKVSSEELAITLEKLDKANAENADLSGRLGDLEEQLETLQRLLTLKNDQLASLQEQMQANELAKLQEEQVAATAEQTSVAEEAANDAEMAVAEAGDMAKSDMADATAEADGAMTEEKVADAPVTSDETPKEEPKAEETKVAQPEQMPAEDTTQTPASGNFIEQIISNPLYMAIAAVGILILIIVLWLVSRNNAERELEYHDTDLDEDDYDAESAFEESEGELADEDGELDDDYEESDGGSVAEEEVIPQDEDEDAIAEADVYIAYGRLDQAAGILEDAISKEPVRTDYRLKLLEVYKESNDVESFNRQFSELEAIQDPDALEQANQIRSEMTESDLVSIDDMEQELLDENMQEGQTDAMEEQEASLEAESEALEQESNSFDFDSVEESMEQDEELGIDLTSEDLDVDLDIDLNEQDAASSEPAIEMGDADETVLADATMDESDEGLTLADEFESADDASLLADDELDVALEDVELAEDLDQEKEIELPESLDLDEELDMASEEESEALADETEAPSAEEAVVSDDILEEAVDAIGGSDDMESDLGEGDDFDFLEGTDEASTKLDLARAYIDMGDVEGARDILEEVQSEGSDEQKAEATDLLSSLDN